MEIKQSIEIVIKKRVKCPKRVKTICKSKKGKKCNRRVCCKHIYSFKLKNWKRIKASCKRETNCTSRKKICKWQNIGKNCFRKTCCSSNLVNGNIVVGSTKCIKSKDHCLTIKKEKM